MMFVSPDFIESDLVLFKFVIIVNRHLNDDEEVIG
jgi:hypothetical protein